MGFLVASEHRRPLPTVKVSPSSTVSLPLPTDTKIKRAIVRFRGICDATYTGSPIASEMGYLGRLCNRIQVVANGKDTIKNVNPYMMRMLQLLQKGVTGPRSFSTSATLPTTYIAGTERVQGPSFDYPTSAQFMILNETIELNFEHPLAYGQGKQASLFDTSKLSSAEMVFDFGALDRLQQDGGGVSVAYGNVNFYIDVTLIESPAVEEDPKLPFQYYKETFSVLPITGVLTDFSAKLTRGNNLTGISFLALDGSANAKLSDILIKKMRLLYNSRVPVQDTTWLDMQDDNRVRYGIDAWKSSGNHPQKGFAHMNLMQYGLAGSGLPTGAFNELELRLDSAPTSGFDSMTYTQSGQLMIHTHELVVK